MAPYSNTLPLRACRLTNQDLASLFQLVTKELGPKKREDDYTISGTYDGANISEHSVDEFAKNGEVPEKIRQLSMNFIGRDIDGNREGSIRIFMHEYGGSVDISGPSRVWVNGMTATLDSFFRRRRIWHWFTHGSVGYGVRGMVGTAGFAAAIAGVFLLMPPHSQASGWLFLLAGILVVIGLIALSRLSFAEIDLSDTDPPRSAINGLVTAVSLLAGVVSAIAGVAALLKH
jgi:hypothetical protein